MKQRVLVIDDDVWMAKLLSRRLNSGGFEAKMANNALEAMAIIDEEKPAVIVLDLLMPGPNGIVLLHELQSHADLSKIPVVICTTSAKDVKIEQLQSYGVKILLDKTTMQPDDVVVAVRKLAP